MEAIQAIKATQIDIQKGVPTQQAFQQIFQACMQQAAANVVLINDRLPDTVHQARVGLRRARSALALFKKRLPKRDRKLLNSALREAGQHLATCRDWDVFVSETLPRMQRRFPELPFDRLETQARQQRKDSYRKLAEHQSAINDLIATASIRSASNGSIETETAELLDRVHLAVRRACRHVKTAEDRHTLRKAMKKLRYSVEFLSSLYDAKDVRSYLGHCKETQGILGDMNDAAAMLSILEKLGPSHPALVEWANSLQDKAISHLAKAITEFRAAKPFWD
jgi:triphosphatase